MRQLLALAASGIFFLIGSVFFVAANFDPMKLNPVVAILGLMVIGGIAASFSFYLRERLPYWATLLFGIVGWIASFAIFLWYTKSIQP